MSEANSLVFLVSRTLKLCFNIIRSNVLQMQQLYLHWLKFCSKIINGIYAVVSRNCLSPSANQNLILFISRKLTIKKCPQKLISSKLTSDVRRGLRIISEGTDFKTVCNKIQEHFCHLQNTSLPFKK